MKRTSSRLVLAYFGPGAGGLEATREDLSRIARGICSPASAPYLLYNAFRLPGEQMIAARVTRDRVQDAMTLLRDAGSASVFVMRDVAPVASRAPFFAEPGVNFRRLLLARLRDDENIFRESCSDLEEALCWHHSLAAASEWLLDNSYLAEANIAEVRRYLPKQKPADDVQLYEMARALVETADASATEANIRAALAEDGRSATLKMADLWLFPLMLRIAVISRLAAIAAEASHLQQLREAALFWGDRLAAGARAGDAEFAAVLSRLENGRTADFPYLAFPYFGLCLLEQLREEETALPPVQHWIERQYHLPLSEFVQRQHTHEASQRISTVNAFGTLRLLARLDFSDIFEQVSAVEAELRKDPGGIYPRSDFDTRDLCRHVVEEIAAHSSWSEVEVARCAVRLAWRSGGHVAEYLLADGVAELEAETGTRIAARTRIARAVRRHASPVYFAGVAFLTACFVTLALLLAHETGARHTIFLALLAAFPLSELAIQILNALVISLLPPAKLAKMDFREAIPDGDATLVIVPMMLSSREAVREEAEKLEVRFLANREDNLWFGLLADFTDCTDPSHPADAELLGEAFHSIESLNRRYPGERFVLFHRRREWSASEQCWIGRERKRGKLDELNAFLCGESDAPLLTTGQLPRPIRFVLTLDADTQLPPGSARRLVETIAHPLNRAELDPETCVRRRGYSIIQPRVSIALPEANSTRFTRVFADAGGTDPYCKAVSDAHQDLFSEAIFHGKAIYDVRAFHSALGNRFPPETLLSHDLIEGAHAGVGHASDIELFETIPHGYGSFAKRQHRWIRGDWQIAPWILLRVPSPSGWQPNPLSPLNRGRILDNLRRSLVPIASVLLLVCAWMFSSTPFVWTLVAAFAIVLPALVPLVERWALTLVGSVESWQGAADQIIRAAVEIAFLPHQAWLACDAIIRALYRTTVSRRHLLEWEPANSSGSHRHGGIALRQLLVIAALSVALAIALVARGALAPALPFLLLWIASPAVMRWLDHPFLRFGKDLQSADAAYLRARARRTWRYFDDLVNAENHWLPPDNSQLALRVEVAHRTSPTNIGMWLTSALAAYDFGYLTPREFVDRCTRTVETLNTLERHEGHFLNWYDTATLDPLEPRYVSTVDSGNLLASLWVLEQGCREILNAPVVRPASLGGLADTLAVLKEELGRDRAFAEPVRELDTLLNSPGTIRNLRAAMPPVEKILDLLPQQGERFYWASCLSRELAAWIDAAERYPRHIPLRDLHHESETLARIEQLAAAARRFAEEINMRILYDRGRRLFGVGYAVGNPIEFTSHYDLLASECRLASLAAIAKGDVPRDHWNALGRPRAATHRPILLSWSGTMFEYLMPVLFTRSFIGSLLDRACQDAVAVQIAHGRREDLPWGVSECAFSAIDANRIYQYRAFGVPGLALKREVEDVAVVAPYATMLALQVTPTPSIENLRRLERMGLNGPMGFYEAVDFSRESKRGEAGLPIYAYMSHHQGMSLVAMDNALHQGPMQRRFHAELRVRAFESLLYERVPIHRLRAEEIVPRHAPVHTAPQDEPAEQIWKTIAPLPRVHLNGNGRYLLALTDSGTGFSRWNGFDVTRWRSDSANDFYGAFVYLRDVESSTVWSASRKPLGADWGTSWTTFSPDRATFFRRVSGIETRMQVTAAPEDDVEVRRITILNRSGRTREIELTSYMELALAPHRADSAHPAFSKMFIETECLRDGVLIAHRRLRSPDEPAIWVAHVLTGASGLIEFETDRAKFLGRGNTARNPAALNRDLSGEAGDVLDPIFSLRCRIALEGKQTAEVALYTIAASSRAALLPLIEKYARQEAAARTFEMAWTGLQLQLRFLGVRSGPVRRFQQLAGQLLYPNPSLRATRQRIARNRLGQSDLWGLGISGDLPMLAATISDRRDLAQIRELLLAHSYCRLLGFHFDLIVLNQEPPSYDGPLRQDLTRVVAAHAECVDCPGGVFIRDWSAISDAQRDLILASAAVVLHAARGPMEQQISAMPASKLPNEPKPPVATAATPLPELNLQFSNGFGGFTADEYVIDLKKGVKTPAPWVNVIANERFGTMLTERGLGCTWNVNSQTNRLTAWHNDPVSDPQAETITLRDQTSGAAWTVPSGEYRVRHGAGYSIFEQNCAGLAQRLTVFIPPSASIKVCRLELRNESAEIRSVKAAYSAELVLGTVREDQQLHIQTAFDEPSGARIAWQYWSATAAGWIAFLASEPRGESGAGEFDLNTARVDLAPGESKTITFLLGQAATLDAARQLIETHRHAEPDRLWGPLLTTLQVSTPLPSADLLLNRWLLYQALSCRFWGRTALYQSSGAFGFRDQLQDCLAFVYAAPQITRSHILACAARQFQEGDVQHWWHPDTGLGVRTRCSDDLLWLPYAAGRYIEITEDRSILAENAPFLEGAPLGDAETDRVFIARDSEETAPLIEHVRRALNRAYRLGEHGLPLIGTGDWNDGLNRVGIEGRGESVWLAWFVIATLRQWAKLDPAGPWADRAGQLAATVEKYCWDGGWYLRGFFDDGSPLGSHVNSEARIDSLPQSWAVISGAANPARARTAMDSAERHLVDERARIVKLFTPPFDHSTPHPGYIMGYPPGVRENGGQYTHGSLWLAMARARMGDGDRAVNLLQMMNPIEHSRDRDSAGRYAGEPYVSAADVYAAPGKEGRAGWTWYTGSAAWMYRIWIEEVLGFKLRGNRLTMQPSIPEDWPGFDITYRYGSATYEIRVEQRPGTAPGGGSIDLLDDGRVHRVLIVVSRKQQAAGTVEELQSVPRK